MAAPLRLRRSEGRAFASRWLLSLAPHHRVAFCGDVHLSPDDSPRVEVFLEFLHALASRAHAVVVLGDLFDRWLEAPLSRQPAPYRRALEALRELVRGGVWVGLLHGNRDFLLGAQTRELTGAAVPGDRLALEGAGRRWLALHGDTLCTRDRRYQFYRSVVRSELPRWVARWTPLPLVRGLTAVMRRLSQVEVTRKSSRTLQVVPEEAARELRESKLDALICGHVHRAMTRRFFVDGRPCELVVVGDWDDAGSYVLAEGGQLALHRWPG